MAAPLTAADFGDSVQGVSGVSGVPGVSDVPPAKHRKQSSGTPPNTLRPDWGTSTALRGCIAGDGAFADDGFPELHIMPPKQTIVSLGYKPPVELHHFAQIYYALKNNPASLPLPTPPVELCLQKV